MSRVLLESAVLCAARSCREAEFLEVGHSVEMNKSSRDHQDVKELVGVELQMADRETLLKQTNKPTDRPTDQQTNKRARYPYPDIALSREEPFGDASGVQAGSGDVEAGHEQQPAHLSHGGGSDRTLADDKVKRGNHAAQTQTYKHA